MKNRVFLTVVLMSVLISILSMGAYASNRFTEDDITVLSSGAVYYGEKTTATANKSMFYDDGGYYTYESLWSNITVSDGSVSVSGNRISKQLYMGSGSYSVSNKYCCEGGVVYKVTSLSCHSTSIVSTLSVSIQGYPIYACKEVVFESNGGTEVSEQYYGNDYLFEAPSEPIKGGYTFNGWYLDSNLTTPISDSKTYSSSLTLYAKWTINQYTVSFESSDVASITQDYGKTVDEPEMPTRRGYSFAEWYTDAQLISPVTWPLTIGANDVTLHAAWTANTYTVNFDSQDGEVSPAAVTVTYDSTYGALPTLTQTGYTFNGWFTEKDGDGTQILGTDTVSITLDTTLYAAWTINQYTVTFESNGGAAVPSQTVNYSGTITEPTEPTMTAHVFLGWYSDAELTLEWDFSSGTIGASDMNLYAGWALRGDVNQNGTIDLQDYMLLEKAYLGTITLTATQEKIGDMDSNGNTLELGDCVALLQLYLES